MITRDELLTRIPGDSDEARRAREVLAQIASEYEVEQQRLLALFEEAPVFMSFLEGPELRNTLINRRLREVPEGALLLGRTAREIYREDNPILAVLERVYATGQAETIRALPPYFPSGAHATRYFTRSYAPIRDVEGNVRGILALGYEVTEEVRARLAHEEIEQRSQAELQGLFALLEEAPVMLVVVEAPDWRLTMANRCVRELLGEGIPLGASLRDLVPPDNSTLGAIERVHGTGRSETHDIVSQMFAGRSFSITLVPIRNPDGAITRVMAAAVEITAQRRAHEFLERQARDLELARREAVDAGRAKEQFLAMLGHELRNPLAPMLTALEVMRLDGATSPAFDILERQIRHLTRLVDDLLDISRITRGKVVLKRQDLELATIVNRALEMASPLLEKREHRVVSDLVLRGLGVSGDPDRLAQVVANLMTNAAKYSEPGSQIRIVARRSGDRVTLSVSDDGVGIAPEMLGRVFDAFVQQPQTLARSHGGLGLGLSIVKSLVEAHGGVVSAHSDGLGRGSTFVVDLPAIEVRSVSDVLHAVTSTPATAPRPGVTPLRILVVDDNRDAADILKVALEAMGHAITIAYDGPSALEVAKTRAPQIALVDIGLPVMDGYRLAELLRAAYDIPVVAITGYGQESDRDRSRTAGFAAHLVKPVDLRELAELVSRLCSRTEAAGSP